ncbi:MAG: sugar phosphate nucleotidyltransferase [Candidatus Saccharibacteria bacterium]|nr:sugar phosphate nucleotidyltransferase [Candidatus Saccharibacteria bacterium]
MANKITKAIIPVAGWGTRRLPITKIIEKSMLPVGNRPLVDYSVQELIEAGVTDIYMVISNVEPCQVREFYQDNLALNLYLEARGKKDRLELAKTLPDNVKIHYVSQDPSSKYGTAIPVAMVAEEYNLNEPVFVFMGDDFIWNPGGESSATSLLKAIKGEDESALLAIDHPHSALLNGGALTIEDEKITKIQEKPSEEQVTGLASVSKYIIAPSLMKEIVDYVHANDFGAMDQEYMITDPFASYIAKGGTFRAARTAGEYLDGGTLEGWVHANNVVCGGEK